MKQRALILAALAVVLAACGEKEGGCPEGTYPVTEDACCQVGQRYELGLCVDPASAATSTPTASQPIDEPNAPIDSQQTCEELWGVEACAEPATAAETEPQTPEIMCGEGTRLEGGVCVVVPSSEEPPPTPEPPPPPPPLVDLMAIEGTWLFANRMTGNSCSPEEKGKTMSEVIILERNGQSIADRTLSGIPSGCQKISDTELAGTISSTGIFFLSKRAVSVCSVNTVTSEFSYSGKFDGATLVGTQSVSASYSQSGTIVKYCTFNYDFTATR